MWKTLKGLIYSAKFSFFVYFYFIFFFFFLLFCFGRSQMDEKIGGKKNSIAKAIEIPLFDYFGCIFFRIPNIMVEMVT